MRRSRLLVIAVLLVGTITVYLAALYQSIEAYEHWKETKLKEYYNKGIAPLMPYIDPKPYHVSTEGEQMILIGALLTLGWLLATAVLSGDKNQVLDETYKE